MAQLSSDAIALLFCNDLSEQGREFKPLIEKYALLKNWRKPQAFQALCHLYPPIAYGE
jgi:Putative phage abortive infection protein